jgi:hypothetical protein
MMTSATLVSFPSQLSLADRPDLDSMLGPGMNLAFGWSALWIPAPSNMVILQGDG